MKIWSTATAQKIGNTLGLEPSRREVIAYGILVTIGNLIGLVLVLVIAYVLGALLTTAALVGVQMLLRPYAGGAHCGSTFSCNLLGCLLIPPLGLGAALLAAGPSGAKLLFLGAALLVAMLGIVMNAPYLTTVKPRAEARRKRLKIRALVLAVLLFAAALCLVFTGHAAWGTGLAAGLIYQGFMLLPPGFFLVKTFDFFVNIIATKLGGELR